MESSDAYLSLADPVYIDKNPPVLDESKNSALTITPDGQQEIVFVCEICQKKHEITYFDAMSQKYVITKWCSIYSFNFAKHYKNLTLYV